MAKGGQKQGGHSQTVPAGEEQSKQQDIESVVVESEEMKKEAKVIVAQDEDFKNHYPEGHND